MKNVQNFVFHNLIKKSFVSSRYVNDDSDDIVAAAVC